MYWWRNNPFLLYKSTLFQFQLFFLLAITLDGIFYTCKSRLWTKPKNKTILFLFWFRFKMLDRTNGHWSNNTTVNLIWDSSPASTPRRKQNPITTAENFHIIQITRIYYICLILFFNFFSSPSKKPKPK